jgi:hypothetical protein
MEEYSHQIQLMRGLRQIIKVIDFLIILYLIKKRRVLKKYYRKIKNVIKKILFLQL